MKSYLLLRILLVSTLLFPITQSTLHACKQCCITVHKCGQRFGDKLALYLSALYLSHKHQIPFSYTKTSDEVHQLRLANLFRPYHGKKDQRKKVHVDRLMRDGTVVQPSEKVIPSLISNAQHQPTTFFVNYKVPDPLIPLYKNDPEFIKKIKQAIAPQKQLTLMCPPKGFKGITVATHVRTGWNSDKTGKKPFNERQQIPTQLENGSFHIPCRKFMPEEYYIEQIRSISHMFSEQQIYVFLFTDHPNPQQLASSFMKIIDLPNVVIEGRSPSLTCHSESILPDFFSLLEYDILVRGDSNFSMIAELLGDFNMIFTPLFGRRQDTSIELVGAKCFYKNNTSQLFINLLRSGHTQYKFDIDYRLYYRF